MTRSQKARRSGILCWHFLRNLAFYRSWYLAGRPLDDEQFWITANGNFLDIAVLEWCKLFVDSKGKHYFSKALEDPNQFKLDLLEHLRLAEAEFDYYIALLKSYRDKFIAHLDDDNIMHIPHLRIARRSVMFMYKRLLEQEAGNNTFIDAPPSPGTVYKEFLCQGMKSYGK